jgi:uncharacterized membrane protein
MLIFKALHILSMVTMVVSFIGGEFFYAIAIRRRDVHALAFVQRAVRQGRLAIVGLVALVAGILFGLLTAATGGLDFFAGWLIAAYVLVAAIFVNTALFGEKLIKLADQAIEADAGQRPAEEVIQNMATSRATLFLAIMAAILAALILDMVLKPF